MDPRKPLFRTQALQQYAQSREKTVLPRVAAPPVFLCGWVLLGLLFLTMSLAWRVQVPIYARAAGVLWQQQPTNQKTNRIPGAILFVPATPVPVLHTGDTVALQVALTGEPFTGTVALVEPEVIMPEEARQRYALTGDLALVITQPSVVVQVTPGPTLPTDVTGNLSLSSQVQVGMQSVLSLLPHLLNALWRG